MNVGDMNKSDKDGFEIIGGAYIDLSVVVGVSQIRDDLDYESRKVKWKFSVVFLDNEFSLHFDTLDDAKVAHLKLVESLVEYQSEVL